MEVAAAAVLSSSSCSSSASASLTSFRHSSISQHFYFFSPSARTFFPPTTNSCSSFSSGSSNLLRWPRPLLSSRSLRSSRETTVSSEIVDNFSLDSVETNAGISNSKDTPPPPLPKIDKSGRFCSPRAARELALIILYASCLEGSDPVRLFEKRLNARRESGYEFDKTTLTEYDHMRFGGPPVTVQTDEEADEILGIDQKESDIEAEVLSAPPKLVYSKLILRFTRKLLLAVVEKWDNNVLAIDRVVPPNWKNDPAGRILELSILHLAMSEIAVLGTRHQIVINEAVDLAKRFCDGAAPRILNGCLRTFVKELSGDGEPRHLKIKQIV